ncbi:type II toxin-antitoxin system RelE/ParE family toxin, partial [Microcoleus sp. S28C3]|uniref:type II toxin-antitoxin system RelE/ParE family toxin n=1 Tax=Microcoleus sp. S28C3 TaxID=3055414 RepID=UPI002FD54591
MNSYTFSDEAVRDLNDICEYIAGNSSRAARELFDAIRQKCKLVAEFPNMGKRYERLSPRVRASQSVLTKGFEKKHHVFIIHC